MFISFLKIGLTIAYFNLAGKTPVLKTALQMYVNGKIMNGALNLNNVRCEASSHLRNKKKEYLKAKIEELENNSKIKISGTCTEATMTFRRVTILERIYECWNFNSGNYLFTTDTK